MPYLTELIDGGTGILRTGLGAVTGQELLDAAASLLAVAAEPRRITHALTDFSRVTSFDVSTAAMRQVVELNLKNSEAMGILHIAIVAPTDVAFGMSRMYGSMVESCGWTVTTFRTLNEARAWLVAQLEK